MPSHACADSPILQIFSYVRAIAQEQVAERTSGEPAGPLCQPPCASLAVTQQSGIASQ